MSWIYSLPVELLTPPPSRPGEDEIEPMGIDTPLVDAEGYPRNDVDVHRARELRHRLAVIRTDHKVLMKEIEKELIKLSAFNGSSHNKNQNNHSDAYEKTARAATKPKPKFDPLTGKWVVMNWDGTVAGIPNGEQRKFDDLESRDRSTQFEVANDVISTSTAKVNKVSVSEEESQIPLIPFAVIDSVSSDSPADEAGLHEGDLIAKFGSADYTNHRNLKAIASLVPQAAGANQPIDLIILRRRNMSKEEDIAHSVEAGEHVTVRLSIRPRPWNGRGLIGCHIVGYDPPAYKEPHQ